MRANHSNGSGTGAVTVTPVAVVLHNASTGHSMLQMRFRIPSAGAVSLRVLIRDRGGDLQPVTAMGHGGNLIAVSVHNVNLSDGGEAPVKQDGSNKDQVGSTEPGTVDGWPESGDSQDESAPAWTIPVVVALSSVFVGCGLTTGAIFVRKRRLEKHKALQDYARDTEFVSAGERVNHSCAIDACMSSAGSSCQDELPADLEAGDVEGACPSADAQQGQASAQDKQGAQPDQFISLRDRFTRDKGGKRDGVGVTERVAEEDVRIDCENASEASCAASETRSQPRAVAYQTLGLDNREEDGHEMSLESPDVSPGSGAVDSANPFDHASRKASTPNQCGGRGPATSQGEVGPAPAEQGSGNPFASPGNDELTAVAAPVGHLPSKSLGEPQSNPLFKSLSRRRPRQPLVDDDLDSSDLSTDDDGSGDEMSEDGSAGAQPEEEPLNAAHEDSGLDLPDSTTGNSVEQTGSCRPGMRTGDCAEDREGRQKAGGFWSRLNVLYRSNTPTGNPLGDQAEGDSEHEEGREKLPSSSCQEENRQQHQHPTGVQVLHGKHHGGPRDADNAGLQGLFGRLRRQQKQSCREPEPESPDMPRGENSTRTPSILSLSDGGSELV
uniref:Transmembrane protein n=2 Tax=Tetraselmis sp. GSL018 TaxID=582737 RepID=A0A061SGR1_9CHLO